MFNRASHEDRSFSRRTASNIGLISVKTESTVSYTVKQMNEPFSSRSPTKKSSSNHEAHCAPSIPLRITSIPCLCRLIANTMQTCHMAWEPPPRKSNQRVDGQRDARTHSGKCVA